jgi:gamma-glutamyl:cysteine ligase YbdK (ATP-grasp superfamily)
MTLRTRVQTIERRVVAAVKDPAEMTLAELYEATLQEAQRHPPDDALQRTLDKLAVQLRKTGALA